MNLVFRPGLELCVKNSMPSFGNIIVAVLWSAADIVLILSPFRTYLNLTSPFVQASIIWTSLLVTSWNHAMIGGIVLV